ncbi:MAG: hypothetical protein P4L77_12680 [Sulfuriferula sp.]|nr:hypothetical protein [Sulfuriferula sp.]
MSKICVVHLVRAQNGIEPFSNFIESYLKNPSGIEHDLLIVFKGFSLSSAKEAYLKLLAPLRFSTLEVTDAGFDITAYFAAFECYADKYCYFCFLNSFSVIQDSEWLSKLYNQISQPGVGLVGATGSWQSHRSLHWAWLPISMIIAAAQHYRLYKGKPIHTRLVLGAVGSCQHGSFFWDYDPFPNYHLRTNAFMIAGALMGRIKRPEIKSKMDAYRFESGKKSLTRQILKMGQAVLVIGKNGKAYEISNWKDSETFWQSDQGNLLVADNQTRDYQNGDARRRKYLSTMAWG